MQNVRAFWKTHRWFRFVIELSLFFALFFGIRTYQHRDMPTGPAPALIAMTLDGKPFNLSANDGRATLVHFWATWCPICRSEQDSIASIARDYRVIAVAMQSGDTRAVQDYVTAQHWPVPVINDAGGELAQAYGVRGVPASFIVDAKGYIRTAEVGYTTEWGLRLRLWWYALRA